MRALHDMAYSDDEMLDHVMGSSVSLPDYPVGLGFTLSKDDLGKFCEGDCSPGMTIRFSAIGTATSFYKDQESCRIEVEVSHMAGDDGQFAELESPASICLCGPEMEKIDLCDDCERGDMIHFVGTARIERVSSSSYGGDMIGLQIVEMAIENESEESRAG